MQSYQNLIKFSKKKSSLTKQRVFWSFILTVFVVIGVFSINLLYFPKDRHSNEKIVFRVERGESLNSVAEKLAKENLIKSKLAFQVYILLANSTREIKAGKYELSPSLSLAQIANKLVSGETINPKISILEGWTLRDVAQYFEQNGMFQREEIYEVAGFPGIDLSQANDLPPAKDFSEEFSFLKDKPKNVSLEGYLFPDTYEIHEDESVEEIIRKFLRNFERKLTPEIKEEIKKQGKSLFEVLTMASILEKELKNYEDKQIAAGILWKRLKNNWPLQVDATLTYITGKKSRELTKKDLQIDSPYNTYKYRGLPLGPICNPGLESIKAAVYYKDSPYWFYLTTDDGKVIFSKTFKEHVSAKKKYLK